jgi:tetratricopeptide (TPR) repeat protein
MHSIGCSLALCLSRIDDDQGKALSIFDRLSSLQRKPANFYINFAFALLGARRASDALAVCRKGISHYPDDPDLLGNLAIALLQTDQTSEAAEVCLKRLSIRRDVHSLEESAITLYTIAADLKWKDLPSAAKYAKLALELATEGISLNPNFPSLFLARADIYRFFNRNDLAATDYKAVSEIPTHHALQDITLLRFVRLLETERLYESALSLIGKWSKNVSSDDIRQEVEAVEMRIIFKQLMLDKTQGNCRAVVPEVVEFFHSAKAKDGRPKYPVDLAKVEDWIGRRSDAIAILKAILEAKRDDLDTIQSLAEILSNAGDYEQAAIWAKRLIEIGPWKAEAYDLAALVCGRAENEEAAAAFKAKGDEVLARESELLKL